MSTRTDTLSPYSPLFRSSEFEQGAQYRKHFRKSVSGGEAQLMLDENALAAGHDYFRLGAASVSKSGRYLAYSTDTNGSERRSEEHTSELQSLMRISYAVFCLKKKKKKIQQ